MKNDSPDTTPSVKTPNYEVRELSCVISQLLFVIRTEKRIRKRDVFDYFRGVPLYQDWSDEYLGNTLARYAKLLKRRGKIGITLDEKGEITYFPRGRIEKRIYELYYKIHDSI